MSAAAQAASSTSPLPWVADHAIHRSTPKASSLVTAPPLVPGGLPARVPQVFPLRAAVSAASKCGGPRRWGWARRHSGTGR
jgi:hypothetical protein